MDTPVTTTQRIGLLGTGPWAARTHAPAIAGLPGAVFSGVWGRRPEAAAELAAAHGTEAYADVDALFAASDAVAFALPPDVQAPLAVRAARAGCHVLLDKPVATDVTAAAEVVAAVADAGVRSVVFCTLRFSTETERWLAEQSAVEGWFTAEARWLSPLFTEGSNSPYAASPWRREKGALWDVGPHVLSVLLPLLGDATEVTAGAGPADTAHLVLRHASGASSTATLSLSAPAEAAGAEIRVHGEAGTSTMPHWTDPQSALRRALAALFSDTPHPCDARFGLRITEVLAQAEGLLK